MDVNALISMVTEGLDPASAAAVRAAIERDAVKTRVSSLRQQDEWDTLNSRAAALEQELADQGTEGQANFKPGTRRYKKWYDENYPKIQKLQKDMEAYQQKYGSLDAPSNTPPANTPPANGKTYTDADIQRIVDERVNAQYAPRWADLLVGSGKLVQKHMFAGRKTPLDFEAVSKLAMDKYSGNLELAYDEWDKPEREKVDKENLEKEIQRRVDDEMAKRRATTNFPAAADFGPSALSQRTKQTQDSFDPQKLKEDLANEWVKAGQAA